MISQYPQALFQHVVSLRRSTSALINYRRQYERLKASEARFRDLYENAPIPYFTVDAEGVVQGANRRARRLLASDSVSLTGRQVLDLYADTPGGREWAQTLFQRFKAGLPIDGEELEMRKLTGDSVWVSLTVEPITDEAGHVVASRSAVVDVSRRRALEAELRERVRLDPLTGALNHAAIVEEIETLIASSPAEFSVCMVDLIDFKAINDTFGHLAGDDVLKRVAQALKARRAIIGRFGGDEFLVILEGSPSQARFDASRAAARLTKVGPAAGVSRVEASFGFAHYPGTATSTGELIRLADLEMYRSRRSGRHSQRKAAV